MFTARLPDERFRMIEVGADAVGADLTHHGPVLSTRLCGQADYATRIGRAVLRHIPG